MNVDKEDMEKKIVNEEVVEEEIVEEVLLDSTILKAKDDEINELNNRLMRLQADFINYKKRTDKEKESSILYGIESLVCEMLPVVDNFQRAMASEVDKEDNFYKGISLIEQQLVALLKNNSVEEIDSLGQNFDPNYHHAVIMEESETHDSGIVIEVLQKGYKLKDKVIRPSMVKVSK